MKFRNFLIVFLLFSSILIIFNKLLNGIKIYLGSIEIESPQIYWEKSIKPSIHIKSINLIEDQKYINNKKINHLNIINFFNNIFIEKFILNHQTIEKLQLKYIRNSYLLEANYLDFNFRADFSDLKKINLNFLNQDYQIRLEEGVVKFISNDRVSALLKKQDNNIMIKLDNFNQKFNGDFICNLNLGINCHSDFLSYSDLHGNLLELNNFSFEKNQNEFGILNIDSLIFKNEKIKKENHFEVRTEKENFILKEKKEGNIYRFSKSFPEIKYIDEKNKLAGLFKLDRNNISFEGSLLFNDIFLQHPRHSFVSGLLTTMTLNQFNYDMNKNNIYIELIKTSLLTHEQKIDGDFKIEINKNNDITVKSEYLNNRYAEIYNLDLIDSPAVTIAKFDSNIHAENLKYFAEKKINLQTMKFKNKLYIDSEYLNFNSESTIDFNSKKNIISKSNIRITPDLYSIEIMGDIDNSNYYCIFSQNKNTDFEIDSDCNFNFLENAYIKSDYENAKPLTAHSKISKNEINSVINLNDYKLKNIPSLEKCTINFMKDTSDVIIKAEGKNNNFLSLICHDKNCDLDFSADYLDATKLISDKKSNFYNLFNIKSMKADVPSVKIGDTIFKTQIYKKDEDTFLDINSDPIKGMLKNSKSELDLILEKLDFYWISKNYKKFSSDHHSGISQSINLECKNAAWKDFNIGELNITTQGDNYEKIYDLKINNDHWSLKSIINDSEDFTKANGIIHLDQSDIVVNKIFNNKYISDGKLDIVFNDFFQNKKTKNMEGSIDVNIEDMFIHHLNFDSLKFLNVLSGFVFSKSQAKSLVHDGLPVDSLKGKLSFHEKKVFFDSVIIKSGATDFDISGYYDFSHKFLDADIIASPQVTGVLPTAALLLGNIPASILMAGFHYFMGDEITKMNQKHLKVKGPIKDLVIERAEAIVESRE